jgi:hypothetical protein
MKNLFAAILIIIIVLTACSPSSSAIQLAIVNTEAAKSTPTDYPTHTSVPTYTPYPTHTTLPTYTPYPTYTPLPTYTLVPTLKPIVITATSSPAPLYTPTETLIPTSTNTPTPTTDQLKLPRGNGFYLVNSEIAPGVWKSDGTGDSCYWAVTKTTGDIIDNHFGMAGVTVYIPADGFQVEFNDCGTWTWLQD